MEAIHSEQITCSLAVLTTVNYCINLGLADSVDCRPFNTVLKIDKNKRFYMDV